MRFYNKEKLNGYIFASPSIGGFLIFFAIPFSMSLFYCFTKGASNVEYVGFANFLDLFKNSDFQLAVKNTVLFNLVSVPLLLVISLLITLVLNSSIKGSSFFRTTLTLPLVIPVASIILIWQLTFAQIGFLNQILINLGISGPDYINTRWSFIILVLLYIWKNCGYNMIIFLAGLNSISKEYYEAAAIDGYGTIGIFLKITLPLLVPTIFFVLIISIINSLRVYREAYLLFGKYPESSVYMLQHFINNNFASLDYQRLATASVIVFIAVAAALGLLFKLQKSYEI
ncbi:carbohydrate ABC transporter permease [Clostridium manihotivorum]|uniref:Sugar ABC transporter permease n=1 Tax=Clostridium manihotivorum TaxID=2320868 RepID=A0A410DTI6_9CLOT|nr:sugar ABC transporter permease [Clostridium manihotivorum]QAA32318.1 sugar ABC transporter permease [Clostridium manihotivorum]